MDSVIDEGWEYYKVNYKYIKKRIYMIQCFPKQIM